MITPLTGEKQNKTAQDYSKGKIRKYKYFNINFLSLVNTIELLEEMQLRCLTTPVQ